MPLAYVSTALSTCPRSHGTCSKSRWWAASRRATYSRTSSSGSSRPSPYALMLAGISAAVPAGPSGSPMSPAESTSAASEPSAWPSWPPKRAPPSVVTIDCIGPSWARASGGTRSPIAATMRPATGSQSLRHTSSVLKIHSLRFQASADRMPEGSADAGSSQRSARRSASSTAWRSTGSPRGRRRPTAGWLRHLAGQVPVDRTAARRGEQLLQLGHELLHLLRVVGVGRLAARQREAERDIRHVSTVRAPVAGHRHAGLSPGRTPGRALRVGGYASAA